jgi:hypothetical protein
MMAASAPGTAVGADGDLASWLGTGIGADAAMAWAAQVKDETRRRETFSKSYTTWRTLDPAAADAWAADHAAELGGPTR